MGEHAFYGQLVEDDVKAVAVTTVPDAAVVTPNALKGMARLFLWVCAQAAGTGTLTAPINGAEGQIVTVSIKASGGQKVISLSGFIGSTDFSTAAVTIPAGKWWTGAFLYLPDIGWQVVGKVLQA
jgi:hypothetical protein